MIYIIIIAIAYYYFLVHRKKTLLKRMVSGIDMVKIGVYGRLSQRFKAKYGEEQVGLLATAVTNELFSELPSNPSAEKFLKSNKDIVERELSNLRSDDEICNAVTQAVRVKLTISYDKGNHTQEQLFDPLEKLKKFGILVSGGDTPSPDTFLPMAYDFYQSVNKENKDVQNSR
jgi:hypothetical protein